MKNIHLIPTDKPSRLYLTTKEYIFEKEYSLSTDECQNKHIYITNSEEIKEGDWFLEKAGRQYPIQWNGIGKLNFHCKKIILTTDQDLIKDGVQAIDDEFLEWFVNNSSCEEVKVEKASYDGTKSISKYWGGEYKIIIPKEEPKQETLEEAMERYLDSPLPHSYKRAVEFGAKWQAERMYSEVELLEILASYADWSINGDCTYYEWFEKFKKK